MSTIFYTGIYNKLVGVAVARLLKESNLNVAVHSSTNCDGEIVYRLDRSSNDENSIKNAIDQFYRSYKKESFNCVVAYYTFENGEEDKINSPNEIAEVIGERFDIDKCYGDYKPIIMMKDQFLFALEWMLKFSEEEMMSKYGDEYERLKKSIVKEARNPFETEKVRMFREDTKSMEVGSDEMKKCMNEYFG